MEQKSKFINNREYMANGLSADLEDFVKGGRIKSGYFNLDLITNLYPGFYVLGAVSSLGKTTFIHQMTDQIACVGQPVLFFSLEQTRLELTTKSLSRIMAQVDARTARTSLQIRKGRVDERVMAAQQIYSAYADNVYVVENTFSATMNSIEKDVETFINEKKQKPVIIIDYLQVIQPPEGSNKTAKDLVDMHVSRLKKLQAKYKLVMMVVSSFNRQNYLTQVDFESFKESGGIEYTADVVWGLQLEVLHDALFNSASKINEKRQKIKEAKAANPRRVELVCLKNRFGVSSYTCNFEYFPQFDLFRPIMPQNISGLPMENADLDGFVRLPEGFNTPFDA